MRDSISAGALKTEDEHRRDICTVGHWILDRGYVASTDGNISVRLDSRRILTSPTAISKGMMTPDDLVITDLEGHKISGRRNRFLGIGNASADLPPPAGYSFASATLIRPLATGYAAAGVPLNKALLSEVVISLGCIPVARYGTPGTPELSDALEPLVQGSRRDFAGQSRRGHLRARFDDRFFSNGNDRAFCPRVAGHRAARQTSLAFRRRCGKIARGARPLWLADGRRHQSRMSGDRGFSRYGSHLADAHGTGSVDRRCGAARSHAALKLNISFDRYQRRAAERMNAVARRMKNG